MLHRRIAEALLAAKSDDSFSVSAQLAHHYEEAQMPEQAIACYQEAAAGAQRVYANAEAVDLLTKALSLVGLQGDYAESAGRIRTVIDDWHAERTYLLTPRMLERLAVAYARVGRLDQAAGTLDEAVCAAVQRGETYFLAELLRMKGEFLLAQGGAAEDVAAHYRDAAALAARQGSRMLEQRPHTSTVRVQGGALWRTVDAATYPYSVAVPSGIISSTGVAGLTLGGGMGHLSRQYGLTIDNLLEVQVVLASGRLVKASETENADLFWALRGGGGNFGVVTSFRFQARPVKDIVGGPMLWDLQQAAEIMRWYRDFIATAPENVNGFFAFLTVPPGPPFAEHLHMQPVCAIVWAINDTPARAEEILAPLRKQYPPPQDLAGPLPFPALQSMFDPIYQPGMQWYWRGDFVDTLSDEAIARHLEFARQLPTPFSTMHLYPVNGAVHRVGPHETAFRYRDATWSQVIVGVDPSPAKAAEIRDWTVRYWEALHPYSAGGSYVNFMMEEGQERVQTTYRDNYPRLAAVKAKYDPENFFRVNQNIRPAAVSADR